MTTEGKLQKIMDEIECAPSKEYKDAYKQGLQSGAAMFGIGHADSQKKEWNIVLPTIGEIIWDETIMDQPQEKPIDIMAVTRGMCK